ncbi:histone methylation protein DOT1-domain-containing protein [Gaertneriomyces semiglobifer]|nr:histone methylation protein DOT1-domain-containing protein [Gaertneriomyces semiglobifer]
MEERRTSKSEESDENKLKTTKRKRSIEDVASTPRRPPEPLSANGNNQLEKKKGKRKDYRYLSKKALEPCIDAAEIVKLNFKPYHQLASDSPAKINDSEDIETVALEYPTDGATELFPLVALAKKSVEYNPTADIYTTVQMIAEHCVPDSASHGLGDVRSGILRSIQKACHKKQSADLRSAIVQWNEEMASLKRRNVFAQCMSEGPAASYPLVAHILEQAYTRAVAPNSHQLNNYEGFSNNVYGEVRHNFVNMMINQVGIKSNHIFVDMGSGIGNVVLQVAAQTLCNAFGIEIMETPAKLAAKQKKEFCSRMRYYAKPCGRITLQHADFLESPEMHEVIKRADVIFVNNYAFSASLNQQILAKFLDLKEGCVVVSLRSFVPVDRPTARSVRRSNAIESIFTAKEHIFGRDCVSWMNESGSWFVHRVDRGQLRKGKR